MSLAVGQAVAEQASEVWAGPRTKRAGIEVPPSFLLPAHGGTNQV